MNNLTLIREACIAAVPSIKSTSHKSKDGNLRCSNCGEQDSYENRNTCKKGDEREIRLSDVLVATEQKWRTMYSAAHVRAGGDVPLTEGQQLYTIVSKWNLLNDDLSHQSEETLQFLSGLLK